MLLPIATLRPHLLPPAAASNTVYDARITLIGEGVTTKFESFCNRKFGYAEAEAYRVSASCMSVVVPRYPIIGSPAVAFFGQGSSTSSDITANVLDVDTDAGLIDFGMNVPGRADNRIVITYTGGYWIPTGLEGDTQPSGSAEIPADLKLAFVEQVRAVCDAQKLFQTGSAGNPSDDTRVISREIKLLDDVVEILKQYRRFS